MTVYIMHVSRVLDPGTFGSYMDRLNPGEAVKLLAGLKKSKI